jgi:hypothetical protein
MTTTYRFENDHYLHTTGTPNLTVWPDGIDLTPDADADWSMGATPQPLPWYTPNPDRRPVDWEGATIAGHDSPGWLTATIVVGSLVGSALLGAYGFLWICGRMLRAVGA